MQKEIIATHYEEQVDKKTLKFVKIDESGIDFTTQTWASAVLMANNNTWTTTVPKTLAPGTSPFLPLSTPSPL
jgi:hypothetical protein